MHYAIDIECEHWLSNNRAAAALVFNVNALSVEIELIKSHTYTNKISYMMMMNQFKVPINKIVVIRH